LDLINGEVEFVENTYSPTFRKFTVKEEDDVEKLELIKDSKDYIDLVISNNLLVNDRKLRRKLETLLEVGSFTSVEYLDDIVSEDASEKEEELTQEELEISIHLDYKEFISNYIKNQNYDNDKFRGGVLGEFNEIIRIYNENYKSKSDT
jgi:hypothetical protein